MLRVILCFSILLLPLVAAAQVNIVPGADVPTGGQPRDASLVDVNEDGILDTVTSPRDLLGVFIHLGNGDGSFQPGSFLPTTLDDGIFIEDCDLDLDGHVDLVVVGTGEMQIVILWGTGQGTFEPETIPFLSITGRAIPRDFNGDGHPDVHIPLNISGGGETLINLGSRMFLPVSSGTLGVMGERCVGDFDGNGTLDFVGYDTGIASLRFYSGAGDGTFTPGSSLAINAGRRPRAGDFDNDGDLDVAVLLGGVDSPLFVLLNDGSANFSLHTTLIAGLQPQDLLIVDLDNDGALDLLVAHFGDGTLRCFAGLGNGSFTSCGNLNLGVGQASLSAGDVDGDGDPDAVLTMLFDGLRILQNNSPTPFRRGECNGDGSLDLGDLISVLSYLFQSANIGCEDGCDADDSGALDVADAVAIGAALFGAETISLPGPPGCGWDLTPEDPLECVEWIGWREPRERLTVIAPTTSFETCRERMRPGLIQSRSEACSRHVPRAVRRPADLLSPP